MSIEILNTEYHRNGSNVCEGFFAVLFRDKQTPKEWAKGVCGNEFIATFRTSDDSDKIIWESVRIINVKNFNLNFRGNYFVRSLEDCMEAVCKMKGYTEISFSALAFPGQHSPKLNIVP